MQSEHKTQIYLSHRQHRALQELARVEGRSMAAIIRDAVARYMEQRTEARPWGSDDPIRGLVGSMEGSPADSSSVDAVLYDRT
jgi:predicted transcriptional regulator